MEECLSSSKIPYVPRPYQPHETITPDVTPTEAWRIVTWRVKKGWLDRPSEEQECHTEERGLNPQIAECEEPWSPILISPGRDTFIP